CTIRRTASTLVGFVDPTTTRRGAAGSSKGDPSHAWAAPALGARASPGALAAARTGATMARGPARPGRAGVAWGAGSPAAPGPWRMADGGRAFPVGLEAVRRVPLPEGPAAARPPTAADHRPPPGASRPPASF